MGKKLPDVTEAFVAVVNWVTAVQVVRVALSVWMSKPRTPSGNQGGVMLDTLYSIFGSTRVYLSWNLKYIITAVDTPNMVSV